MTRHVLFATVLAVAATLAMAWPPIPTAAASADDDVDHVVMMRTEGPTGRFVFDPPLLHVEPGDTVRFTGGRHLHASRTIAGMAPAEGPRWWGQTGEEVTVTFDEPGVYGFKCVAHYSVGMVGLIVVGRDLHNLEEAQAVRHPPRAAETFDRLFERLSAQAAK